MDAHTAWRFHLLFSLLEKKVGYKQSFDFYCGGTPFTKQAGGGTKEVKLEKPSVTLLNVVFPVTKAIKKTAFV